MDGWMLREKLQHGQLWVPVVASGSSSMELNSISIHFQFIFICIALNLIHRHLRVCEQINGEKRERTNWGSSVQFYVVVMNLDASHTQ